MVDKLGKAVLLFADESTGGHVEGMVIIEGNPGNIFWNLIPIPQQDDEKNQEPNRSFAGRPYRRSGFVGFKPGGR